MTVKKGYKFIGVHVKEEDKAKIIELIDAGYYIEDDVTNANGVVVDFPIKLQGVKILVGSILGIIAGMISLFISSD